MTAAPSLAAGNLDVDIDRVDNCVCGLRLRGFRSAHRLLHLGEVDILAKDRDTVCLCVFKNPMVRAKLLKHRFAVFTALEPSLHIADRVGYDHHRHRASSRI
jgi:hypothetical protein